VRLLRGHADGVYRALAGRLRERLVLAVAKRGEVYRLYDIFDSLGGHVDLGSLRRGEWILEHNNRVRCRVPEALELLALYINLLASSAVDDKGSEDGDPEQTY
jgi:hypothetical protein